MHRTLQGISTSGIITPGEIYVLIECESGSYGLDSLEFLYVITSEEEILTAIEMEICIVMAEDYTLKAFLGISKISADCHQFKMSCYYKPDRRRVEYSFYLHRITTFKENLLRIKEFFSKKRFNFPLFSNSFP
jgi:hypothetical protein